MRPKGKSGCVSLSFITANFAGLLAISAFRLVLNAKAAEEDAEFAEVMRPRARTDFYRAGISCPHGTRYCGWF